MMKKGQGSLEYLLLIAGAIIVVAIVLGLVISTTQTVGRDVNNTASNASPAIYCAAFTTASQCASAPLLDCTWNAADSACRPTP